MKPLRALIVDDETLGRRQLARLLSGRKDLSVEDECASGIAAVEAIRRLLPDVVFLDIQMPELDGFGVIDAIGPDAMPPVVFVTAHDEHVLRALRAHAADYLLKPVEPAALDQAITRARERAKGSQRTSRALLEALAYDLTPGTPRTQRLIVSHADKRVVVHAQQIDWLEADDDVVRIHSGREVYTLRETLTSVVSRLDARVFCRIHRSTAVNLDRIREIQPWFHGEQLIVLRDDTKLTIGATFREAFLERLDGPKPPK